MNSIELIKKSDTRSWWLSIILAIMAMFIFNSVCTLIIFMVVAPLTSGEVLFNQASIQLEMSELLGFGGSLFFIIICNKLIYKRPISALGFHRKNLISQYLIGFIIGSIMMSVVVLLAVIFGAFKFTLSVPINYIAIICYLIGFMIQGMTEEVICRGFIQSNISAKFGMWPGIIFNTVLFALLHSFNNGINILPMVNLLLFGLFASLLYYYTDNMWLLGGLHSAWNFFQGPVFGIEVSGTSMLNTIFKSELIANKTLISGGKFGMEGSIFTVILFIFGSIITYYLITKKIKEKQC